MLSAFQIGNFGAFLINFERACAYTEMLQMPQTYDPEGALRLGLPKYVQALRAILETCQTGKVPLSSPVHLLIQRFCVRIEEKELNDPHPDYASLRENARICRQSLLDELAGHLFVCIPAATRELIDQKKPPFGEPVSQTFSKARRDIEACCRCLALNEWTACVFHSMRVLEHGLRELASRVELSTDAMAQENWKNVIDQIESKIRAMEKLPRSAEKSAKLKAYSEAALQFRYFKDAWRNYVSHTSESSDERDASSVWNHVKEFMQQLASDIA